MQKKLIVRAAAVLATIVTFNTVVFVTAAKDPYHPAIDPSNFSPVVNHPYYPLVPGTTMIFTEKDGDETRERTVTVTHDTKIIMGVKCVVVHDVVAADGEVEEDTYDWFAQDKQGTVWYFGEATKEFKGRGRVSTEGSWEAGVNGQPGIIMPAHLVPGAPYREEYSPDNAEDMGQVIALDESVTVPFGTFKGCVRTKEWSLLESGTEKKWYAKEIGLVRVESPGGEVMNLVSVKHK
jgi:hypothetical protein